VCLLDEVEALEGADEEEEGVGAALKQLAAAAHEALRAADAERRRRYG
jgi:hypothetical protein